MLRGPLRSTIELTYLCNQRCQYCYNPHHEGGFISKDTFYKSADEFIDSGVFCVSLAGGEPMLHPDFFEFYDYLADNCFEPPIILTNGSVQTDTDIEHIKNRAKLHDVRIQVSLDSLTPIEGMQNKNIGKTINFIEQLIEAGIKPSVGTVITRLNIELIPDIIYKFKGKVRAYHLMAPQKFFHTKDFIESTQPSLEQVENIKGVIKQLSLLYHVEIEGGFDESELENIDSSGCHSCIGCAAGHTKGVIDPDGNVLACEIIPSITLGNITNTSLSNIWNGEKAKYIRALDFPICHDLKAISSVKRIIDNI